tara:strand:+ start:592 stop:1596 length:1005 start_codon:yes stop_codon:yes gene_type:complete
VLNEQFTEDYDVFIGILWGRIGTPTPRSDSGTLEEFERAYERYKKDQKSIEIMIYFKDAGIAPSDIDPKQLGRVQEFKNSLGAKGGLYSTFTDQESFEASLRAHLSALIEKFSNLKTHVEPMGAKTTCGSDNQVENSSLNEADDELGLLDYLETYENEMEVLSRSVEGISDITLSVGNHMSQHAEQINALPEEERASKPGRRIVRQSAEDIERYSIILSAQISLFAKARRSVFEALNCILVLRQDFNEDDNENLSDLQDSLGAFLDAVSGSLEGLISFRQSVIDLPKLSSKLNRAKRKTAEQLDNLVEEVGATISTTENILESIVRIRKGKESI